MTNEGLKHRRAKIEKSKDILLITVPSMKKISFIIFLVASSCVWILGEKVVVALILKMEVLQGFNIIFMLWFIVWTIMGFYLFLKLLWVIAGREIVTILPGTLKIEKAYIIGILRSREYLLEGVKDIQIVPNASLRHRRGVVYNTFFKGYIKFNYGKKTIAFMSSVDEEEAGYILEQIKQYIYNSNAV